MSSCSPEMRIAKQYVRSSHETPLMFFHTDSLMKISSKLPVADTITDTSRHYLDSLAYAQTKFVQQINNHEFLRQYYSELTDELDKYGFRVYSDSTAYKFFSDSSKGYIVNLAQVELEEFYKSFTSGFMIDENGDSYQFDLDAVALNSWFEISCSNCDSGMMRVMFASCEKSSMAKARMKQHESTGDLYLGYDVTDMNMIDVYTLADIGAKQNASYIFDYAMNEYIARQMRLSIVKRYGLHYDSKKKKIRRAGDKKFIRMK
jgi:hypothetical protein